MAGGIDMEAILFAVCQAGTLRHDVAKWVPCRNVVLRTGGQELYDMMSQSGFYAAQKSLRHRVAKSERGRMIYIYKAVQQEYILPPIRAEPVMGGETAHCTKKIIQK